MRFACCKMRDARIVIAAWRRVTGAKTRRESPRNVSTSKNQRSVAHFAQRCADRNQQPAVVTGSATAAGVPKAGEAV
jgi:hypothetical protein